MGPFVYRCACVSALVALMAAAPAPARADEPAVRASMQCERAAEPGRVRCSVEAHAAAGRAIAWADVQILELPELASPLKARIGREDATAREPRRHTWAFGLVARRTGQGDARVRVRAVTCEAEGGARCAPLTVEIRAPVTVGTVGG
jgi:hypothetical protein